MKKLAEQSHYEVLEVPSSASPAEIRGSYERLRKLLGPSSLAMYSLVEPAEAQALLLRLDEAWAVLSDDAERRRYDASLGLGPALPEAPARNSFRDAVAAIGRAGGGDVPEAGGFELRAEEHRAEEPARTEPAEFVLDEDDLLEVVEIGASGILVATVAGTKLGEGERIYGGISPSRDVAVDPVGGKGAPADDGAPADHLPALGPDTDYSGDLLRRIRLGRGLSLDEIARRTRIGTNHLANIEQERWNDLPERVFLRGYLAAYARELRLDAARVCETYLSRSAGRH